MNRVELTPGFYVYLHCKPDNSVIYVGKGTGKRARIFYSGRNPHHARSIRKLGEDNLRVEVFPCGDDEGLALACEKIIIGLLRDAGHPLCNLTAGGEGISGYRHTAETKVKLKEKRAERHFSPQTRAKIAASKIGKRLSTEHCKNMSSARLGKPWTEEQKAGHARKVAARNDLVGERHPRAILNEAKVAEMRQMNKEGISCKKLARLFQVGISTAEHAVAGRTWKHIK